MKSKDLKILRKKLTKANRIDNDPLSSFSKDDLTFELSTNSTNTSLEKNTALNLKFFISMPDGRLAECCSLFEKNMGELYRKSSWGLNLDEKTSELKHKGARFLLLLGLDDSLAGFVHFRFEYDDEERPTQAVLYLYEIQIDSLYHRQGLGKNIMAIIEKIAKISDMKKVMLTCFKSNKPAMDFYKDLEYNIDETSPSNFNEPADYEILSRNMMNGQ